LSDEHEYLLEQDPIYQLKNTQQATIKSLLNHPKTTPNKTQNNNKTKNKTQKQTTNPHTQKQKIHTHKNST